MAISAWAAFDGDREAEKVFRLERGGKRLFSIAK